MLGARYAANADGTPAAQLGSDELFEPERHDQRVALNDGKIGGPGAERNTHCGSDRHGSGNDGARTKREAQQSPPPAALVLYRVAQIADELRR